MTEEKEKNMKKEVYEWIKSIVLAMVIAILIKTFIFNTTYVLGNSMYPTLHERDRLFTNKIVYTLNTPQHGDIIILKAPDKPNKDYIKRIIGIEGDLVEIKEGKVYLNGDLLKEDYLENDVYTYTYNQSVWEVPKGHVFVLGDNRHKFASKDSRCFGNVKISSIKGKANFRYYPFDGRIGNL